MTARDPHPVLDGLASRKRLEQASSRPEPLESVITGSGTTSRRLQSEDLDTASARHEHHLLGEMRLDDEVTAA